MDTIGGQSSKPLFNWPEDEEIQLFSGEIIPAVSRLHLWTGKTPNPFLTHISFDLNNGVSQPSPTCVFDQRMDSQNMNKHEIEVDSTKHIKQIKVKTRLIGGLFYMKGIEFVDVQGESLLLFETSTEKGGEWTIQELQTEERVTGFHGQVGTNIGFKIWRPSLPTAVIGK